MDHAKGASRAGERCFDLSARQRPREVVVVPYTNDSALALARQLGPLWGLDESQLPTTVFAGVLNGLEICEKILGDLPQQETPVPITQLNAERHP
jgi:hypothetical protein